MKSLNNYWKYTLLITILAITLGGCSDDDTPTAGGDGTGPVLLEKLFVSVESLGVVKSIHLHEEEGALGKAKHAATPTAVEATINFAGNTGATPGEMIFSGGNVYVRVRNTNTVQMFDIESDGLDHNHAIKVGESPVHMYKDKAGKVWIMNDGPRVPNDVNCSPDPNIHPGCALDTVSVINGGEHNVVGGVPITVTVGHGHHKAAFSYPTEANPAIPAQAFVSNISDNTISVIDNDPTHTAEHADTPNTYLTVIETLTSGNVPHGIDFSSHNGEIYNLNVGGDPNAVSVFNATTLTETALIPKGGVRLNGFLEFANTIPVTGRLHTRHAHGSPTDGRFVVIIGSFKHETSGQAIGTVAVIDTEQGIDHVEQPLLVIPGFIPANMLFSPNGNRLYLASGPTKETTGTASTNLAIAVNMDPTSPDFNQVIAQAVVGETNPTGHGSIMALSGDGHFLFVGNTGETTVSVLNADTLSLVGTIDVGGAPSGLGVAAVGGAPHSAGDAGGDTGGHVHG